MENVMEMVRGPLMGEVFGKISGFFRESPEGVRRGFESAVPISMAGLAERASTREGAQELLSTLKGGDYPHLDANELGRAVANPEAAASAAQSGEGFLSRLFGSKQRGIVDGLANSAGVSTSSASKLLGLALPMVLGFVGKQAVLRNLDASGLSGFLTSQRKKMGDALPGPLSRLVGGDGEAQAAATGRPAVVAPQASPTQKPRMGRVLLVVAAVVVALMLLMGRRSARREATTEVPPATPQAQQSDRVSRPVALYAGGIGPLAQALSGTKPLPARYVLSELTFRTDSAQIDPGSTRVLDDVAHAMAAHPGARIRVEGHTDDTGQRETNQALSQARAESTRAYLVSKGVDRARIEAVGYGAGQPLTSNDRPEGREANRRTEIVVLQH